MPGTSSSRPESPSPSGQEALRGPDFRETVRQIFHKALDAASIESAFNRHISCDQGVMRICEDLYDLNSYSRVLVVSIGKAAHTLAAALQQRCGDRFEGIIAGLGNEDSQFRGFRYFRGGHPTPNYESVQAAQAILKSLNALDSSSLAIFLLSGGGSSLMEKPMDDDIPLEDLASTYRALVHSGANIAKINAIRKHLSAVKGGRLAQAAYPVQQVSILISDVPDNTPDALASGPTMPDSTSAEDCYAIAAKHQLLPMFPRSVRELFEKRALEETPKTDDSAFCRSRWWTVLSNASLTDAARTEAERHGFYLEVDNTCDDWDYLRARDYLLDRLFALRETHGSKNGKVCLISGGELTVKVSNGGTGGRNQQFALACAAKIAGQPITVLSAGSDGVDGNSPAAGAIVDGTTLQRAKDKGLEAQMFLENFNAYPFFDQLGDALVTGPTGNNIRDLRILVWCG